MCWCVCPLVNVSDLMNTNILRQIWLCMNFPNLDHMVHAHSHTQHSHKHAHAQGHCTCAHSRLAHCTPHMSLKAFMRAFARCTLALKRYAGIEHQACLQVDARAYLVGNRYSGGPICSSCRQRHPLAIVSRASGGNLELVCRECFFVA